MAGGSTSEEMDAFDDVTPDKPVSIYDLDEDLPTRAQSSDEIAEFQKLAREKREKAVRTFKPPTADGARRPSSPSVRPIPRESGPVPVASPRGAPAPDQHLRAAEDSRVDLDAMLNDVATGLERLPPAPRVPYFEPERGTLETIDGPIPLTLAPVRRPRRWIPALRGVVLLGMLACAIAYVLFVR